MFQITAATAPVATAQGQTPATFSGAGNQFETFLKMLTAQLQNQDPLNPMEGTDFAVQLATFANVEQQALSNHLLTQLLAQSGAGGIGGVADWIGKEARSTAPVWFADDPVTLELQPHALADSVTLVATDAAGKEVRREEIGQGQGEVDWFGRDAQGNKLPDGLYAFHLESRREGELIATTKVSAYARVIEAQIGPEGTLIVLEGGAVAPIDAVTRLRERATGA